MPRPPGRYFSNDPYLLTLDYPHMLPTEREMFRIWVKTYGRGFDGFMFDLRLGAGRPHDLMTLKNLERQLGFPINSTHEQQEEFNQAIRHAWRELTKKRIDAVGFRGPETWLIEIKKILNMAFLGQIMVYTQLFNATCPPATPLIRAAVVGEIDPDVGPFVKDMNIIVYEVPIVRV